MRSYIEHCQRWRWGALLTCLALLCLGLVLSSRLEVRPQLAELLPEGDPTTEALRRLLARVGGSADFDVIIKGDSAQANRRFADALVSRLQKAPQGTWRQIISNLHEEEAFLQQNALLYLEHEDILALYVRLRREVDHFKTGVPLFEEEPIPQTLARLEQKYRQRHQGVLPAEGPYLEWPGVLLVMIRPELSFGGEEHERLYALIDQAVQDTQRELGSDLGVQIIYGGVIPEMIEESATVKEELGISAVLCVVLVCLVVVLFFGQARSIFLVSAPALLGALLSFAVAEVLIGYLTASTAFLGSIILGNGINSALVLFARYQEERRNKERLSALDEAVRATWRPTLASALMASAAYGSLLVTRFRGFNQFGLIGSVGMLLCWALTFTLLPALLLIFRDEAPAAPRPGRGRVWSWLSAAVMQRPSWVVVSAAGLFVASLIAVAPLYPDPFEYDFSKLRNKHASQEGATAASDLVSSLLGRELTPACIAAASPEQAEEVRRLIAARDEARPTGRYCVGRMTTLSDFLPTQQEPKLKVLSSLRALLQDDALDLAEGQAAAQLQELRQRVEHFFPGGAARPLTLADLPDGIASPFTERDGTRGRLLFIERGEELFYLNRHDLSCFVNTTSEITLESGEVLSSSGNTIGVFLRMNQIIAEDTPRAALLALLIVIGVLLLVARSAFFLLLANLLLGLGLMLALGALLGMRLNLLNFMAIPITLGLTSEYGVNLYTRIQADGVATLETSMRGVGGAISLCALTTIIGYGTLLSSDNQALNSFGLLAGVGELSALGCAMLLIPAVLVLRQRRGK